MIDYLALLDSQRSANRVPVLQDKSAFRNRPSCKSVSGGHSFGHLDHSAIGKRYLEARPGFGFHNRNIVLWIDDYRERTNWGGIGNGDTGHRCWVPWKDLRMQNIWKDQRPSVGMKSDPKPWVLVHLSRTLTRIN